MKLKDILQALKGLDPEKEVAIVGAFCSYEVVGVYEGEFGIEIEIEEGQ